MNRQFHKRSKLSPEHRRKLSEANRGEKNPNYGKKASLESRRKNSEAHKGEKNHFYGKHHTSEARKKMSEAVKGKKCSPETRQKMSEAAKGKKKSPEHCRKISEANKGKKLSLETRRKISEAKKGEKNPKGMLGKKHSAETCRKLSEANKGKKLSLETRRKISEALTGEKSHFWRGGISFEPYTPEFNGALKRRIMERDNFTCQICGNTHNLVVHHIDYNKKHNYPSNLIALCRSCHGKTTSRRAYWIAFLSARVCQVIGLEDFMLV